MNYSHMNCNNPSTTEARKRQRERGNLIMDSIEGKRIAEEERKLKKAEQQNNQNWIILLIRMFEEEFKNEPKFFSILERDIFLHWGRYLLWRRSIEKGESQDDEIRIYFRRTFTFVHSDFQRMQDVWPLEMLVRTNRIVAQAYKNYEETTGKCIKIIDIRKIPEEERIF